MKRLTLLLILAIPSWAAIAHVQNDGGSGSNSVSCVTTQAANITAGNFLVATIGMATGFTVSSIGGCADTWTQAVDSATNRRNAIWYCANATGGATGVTITVSAKATTFCNVAEFSGLATLSIVDQTGANNGSSANPTTATINTTNADDLLIASEITGASTLTAGPENSFIAMTTNSPNYQSAYRIVSGTGAYTTNWTFITSSTWDATIASFKAAAAGGAVIKDPIMRGVIARPR